MKNQKITVFIDGKEITGIKEIKYKIMMKQELKRLVITEKRISFLVGMIVGIVLTIIVFSIIYYICLNQF